MRIPWRQWYLQGLSMEMERNELLRCKTAQTQQKQLWAGRGWGGDAALEGGELELELVLTGGIKGIPVSLCTAHSTLRATLTGVKTCTSTTNDIGTKPHNPDLKRCIHLCALRP